LQVRPEPRNRYSSHALGVWVQGRRFLFLPAWFQTGFIPDGLSGEIYPLILAGWKITSKIDELVGGMHGLHYGLRIITCLAPPTDAPLAPSPPKSPPKPFLPALPLSTLEELKRIGLKIVRYGAAILTLGLFTGPFLARHSDILDLGVVLTAAGAGLWG